MYAQCTVPVHTSMTPLNDPSNKLYIDSNLFYKLHIARTRKHFKSQKTKFLVPIQRFRSRLERRGAGGGGEELTWVPAACRARSPSPCCRTSPSLTPESCNKDSRGSRTGLNELTAVHWKIFEYFLFILHHWKSSESGQQNSTGTRNSLGH